MRQQGRIPSIGLVSLGCVRNTVDAQNILGRLERKGHRFTTVEDAEIVIVNTCSFIEEARKESVGVILDLVEQKKQGKIKKIIVAGCLSQRYGDELARELPEVDAFVGVQMLRKHERQEARLLTPPHYAYLKICESCFNRCSFCVIPQLKGRFVSRSMAAILDDVRRLDGRGVKELNIVGQDITAYGMDLYHEQRLADILGRIVRECRSIEWVRLLYAYPVHVTEDLLEVIAAEPKICQYIDIPLQHVNDRILKAMRRHGTKAQLVGLIEKIRRKLPGVFLRTTFIVGFPGETAKEFAELLAFVREHRFERVGVFTYSREQGTSAYDLPSQVPMREKLARQKRLMVAQQEISRAFLASLRGREIKVLIEEECPRAEGGAGRKRSAGGRVKDRSAKAQGTGLPEADAALTPFSYLARSEFDAPDVDGMVYVHSERPLSAGEFVTVRITGALDYDLEAELVRR